LDGEMADKVIKLIKRHRYTDGTEIKFIDRILNETKINYIDSDGNRAEKIHINHSDGVVIQNNYIDKFGKKYSEREIDFISGSVIFEQPMEEEVKSDNLVHGQIEICEFCQYYELKYDECEYDRDCEYQRRY